MVFVSRPTSLGLAAAFLVAGSSVANAQRAPTSNAKTAVVAIEPGAHDPLSPYLREVLARLEDDAFVDVYITFRERLTEDHWFPRVQRLALSTRREVVCAELKHHATRTQREVLDLLRTAASDVQQPSIASNWLGNFVQCRAKKRLVLQLASFTSVDRVMFDARREDDAVADGARSDSSPDLVEANASAASLPIPGDAAVFTRAASVWNVGIRGQGILIANVDGGITSHNDLDARRWTNPGEVPGNGIDDDQNGYVDDVHGFAFELGTAQLDDGGGHGTMTAGLLVGDGTCSGIAYGQAPAAHVMTCRVLSETSHWNAIQYAIAMGADVQTSSFSYKASFVPPPDYRMHRDVATASLAAGLIRCNSSGNDAAFANDPTSPVRVPLNIAAPACVPSPYRDPNQSAGGQSAGGQSAGGLSGVIAVGALRVLTDQLDPVSPQGPFAWSLVDVQQNLPSYPAGLWDTLHHDDYAYSSGTALGLLKPDVLGPAGTSTLTSGPCRVATFAGTSNATPCVAGVIALWKCANPSLTPEDAAMLVHQTASDRGSIAGKENGYGAGLIDAERGLLRALCVHRVDFRSAWNVDHAIASGPVHLAVDGVPNSLCAVAVGYQRTPTPVGPLVLGIGPSIDVVFSGVTDSFGDLAASIQVGPWLQGQAFATQAVLWDQTFTARLLDSNVVEISFP